MKRDVLAHFEEALRRQRAAIFKEVADAEDDLRFIAEDREGDLEERGQEERAAAFLARLDDRGKRELEAIDQALRRIRDATYGTCPRCGGAVGAARLRAMPAALYCIRCAREAEMARPAEAEGGAATPIVGSVPADLGTLSDRELEEALREQIRVDGGVDVEELRIVCRHGVVHLDGAVPSEAEHQILRKLVTDVVGLREVVDRLAVNELLWEREERTKGVSPGDRPRHFEPASTEDIVETLEEGVDYEPPTRPVPEEE